jgi:hypothetical protein
MSTIGSSLAKLRELAPKLNAAADEARKIVQYVENLLAKELTIGLKVDVLVSTRKENGKHTIHRNLSYRRIDGRFRIAVVDVLMINDEAEGRGPSIAEDSEISVFPWSEWPRDTKLETFPLLPQLLETIIKNAEKTRDDVARTQETLEQILPELRRQVVEESRNHSLQEVTRKAGQLAQGLPQVDTLRLSTIQKSTKLSPDEEEAVQLAHYHLGYVKRPMSEVVRKRLWLVYSKHDFFGAIRATGRPESALVGDLVARAVWRECNPSKKVRK